MKCVFLGLATLDIFNYLKVFPESNQKVRAESQLFFAGGPAANAAVTCSALGSESRLITSLGRHAIAGLARQDLMNYGVEVFDWAEHPEEMPVVSSIIVDESTGDRCVVYTRPDASSLLAWQDCPAVLADARLLMIDGHYLNVAFDAAQEAKERSVKTILDGGSWKSGLEHVLPYIDCAICSGDFYPPGCSDVESTVEYLQQAGVSCIAITGGGEPIRVWEAEYVELPIRTTKVVDTLGAGDVFHGAFCHYLGDGNFFQALEQAARIATVSCTYRGTRHWIGDVKKK